MLRKPAPRGILLIILIVGIHCAGKPEAPRVKGPYFGLSPPGLTPEIFAPGILSTHHHEHSAPAFSPDGKEVFWSTFLYFFPPQVILTLEGEGAVWTEKDTAVFSGRYSDGSPFFAPDGKRIFFSSNRPLSGEGAPKSDHDLWFVNKTADGWSEPQHVSTVINSSLDEDHPSVASNGNLYFHSDREDSIGRFDIYVSKFVNGEYTEPENVGPSINTPAYDTYPFIAPDESCILFSSDMEGGFGAGDLYVSFRQQGGGWTKAVNLGKGINDSSDDRFPQVSPDGKFLFFVSNRRSIPASFGRRLDYEEFYATLSQPGNGFGDIYWVDAGILEELSP
jgi:hypothetical protein